MIENKETYRGLTIAYDPPRDYDLRWIPIITLPDGSTYQLVGGVDRATCEQEARQYVDRLLDNA